MGKFTERPGLPVPRRRTFAADILSSALSDADCTPQSLLRLSAYAGSRGTGNPAPSPMKKPEGPRRLWGWAVDCTSAIVGSTATGVSQQKTLAKPRFYRALRGFFVAGVLIGLLPVKRRTRPRLPAFATDSLKRVVTLAEVDPDFRAP